MRYPLHVKSISFCNSLLTVTDSVLLCQKENMKENKYTVWGELCTGDGVFSACVAIVQVQCAWLEVPLLCMSTVAPCEEAVEGFLDDA